MSETTELEQKEKKLYRRGSCALFTILCLSITIPVLFVILNFSRFAIHKDFIHTTTLSLLFSIIAYMITYAMIPIFMQMTYSKKIFGVDINKVEDIKKSDDPDRKEVPEALGIVPATVFLVVSIISQTIMPMELKGQLDFNASLLSICFMIFLGFADDVLDLRWRYKLVLPLIASFPLLVAYSGSTVIAIPKLFHPLVGGMSYIELGILFKIYMSMLAIFCTNAINIYAGINGLEVGQSIIIGISLILYNLIEILHDNVEQNLFSLAIMLPFVFSSIGLFMFNKFPAQCFIGDTYCYFAGMTFACAGILGHHSKTILLFFIPQIINFLVSLPQLLGFVPIARHRLPKFSKATKCLTGQPQHWNLLNIALRIVGPSREQDICNYLLIFQIICSMIGLTLRYSLFSL